jgi:hypothetical protein
MPNKDSVAALTTQSEDGAAKVEVAISLRPRRPKASLGAQNAPVAELAGPPRIPRITRLMALAIKFQEMVDRGEVRDYADLARLGYVTRARVTQIMNLLNLAPDIQQALLDGEGGLRLTERDTRCMTRLVLWEEQRRLFHPSTDQGIIRKARDAKRRGSKNSPEEVQRLSR